MQQRFKRFGLTNLPSVAAGLFLGRFLSEQVPVLSGHSLIGAMIVTLLGLIGSVFVLWRRPLAQTWPLFLLLVYVVYPEPDPQTAVFTLLLVLIIYLFQLDRSPKLIGPLVVTAVAFAIIF